jgi:mycofactocin system creatininase family protein
VKPARRLGDATSPEVADARAVLLVPLGSTEQHGAHLPLDTDTLIAAAIADAAATDLTGRGIDVLVAPALPYGASGEHQGFAGTVSIGSAALQLVVVELVRSVGRDFSLVVLVNGHGGNAEALRAALTLLRAESRPVMVWSPRLVVGDSHAGHTETSLVLALDPDVVRLDQAEPGVTTPLVELIDELRRGGLVAVTPNGVLGDPTGASADEGRRLLAQLVGDLVAAVVDGVDRDDEPTWDGGGFRRTGRPVGDR